MNLPQVYMCSALVEFLNGMESMKFVKHNFLCILGLLYILVTGDAGASEFSVLTS